MAATHGHSVVQPCVYYVLSLLMMGGTLDHARIKLDSCVSAFFVLKNVFSPFGNGLTCCPDRIQAPQNNMNQLLPTSVRRLIGVINEFHSPCVCAGSTALCLYLHRHRVKRNWTNNDIDLFIAATPSNANTRIWLESVLSSVDCHFVNLKESHDEQVTVDFNEYPSVGFGYPILRVITFNIMERSGYVFETPVQMIFVPKPIGYVGNWGRYIVRSFDISIAKCYVTFDSSAAAGSLCCEYPHHIRGRYFDLQVNLHHTHEHVMRRVHKYTSRGYRLRDYLFRHEGDGSKFNVEGLDPGFVWRRVNQLFHTLEKVLLPYGETDAVRRRHIRERRHRARRREMRRVVLRLSTPTDPV